MTPDDTVIDDFCHSSKKFEIKCPESRKNLTTQYIFCLMDADAKRPGGGGRLNPDICGQRGRGVINLQNLVDVFYG